MTAEGLDRLELNKRVFVLVPFAFFTGLVLAAVELERLAYADGRVRDDPRQSAAILRRRVQHQRVHEDHVARLARHFVERRRAARLNQAIVEAQALLVRAGCYGRHVWIDAFRVVVLFFV